MTSTFKETIAEHMLTSTEWESGWVIDVARQRKWTRRFGFAGPSELIRALLENFKPPKMQGVSRFAVVAAAVERKTSDLLVGCNLEFPGLDLPETLHAEQFLALRSWMRGTVIREIHLLRPTPCGHCRQFLNEFYLGAKIRVRNNRGLNQTIAELLPNAFGPRDLDQPGVKPKSFGRAGKSRPEATALLKSALAHAYAPYTRRRQAVVIETKDGNHFPGASLENAAFNPSVAAHTVATAQLIASGRSLDQIAKVLLSGDGVGRARSFFAHVSPGALVQEVKS